MEQIAGYDAESFLDSTQIVEHQDVLENPKLYYVLIAGQPILAKSLFNSTPEERKRSKRIQDFS